MNIESLKMFLVIAQTGNMTKAADELCISQSALSISIKKLEQELGCELFHRNGRALSLNDAGIYLLPWAERTWSSFTEAKNRIEQSNRTQGTVRVYSTIESDTLIYIIASFHKAYPDITVSVYDEKIMPEDYQMTNYDIFVCQESECKDMEHRFIARRDLIFALMRDDHRLADRAVITIRDLENERLILHTDDRGKMDWIFRYIMDQGFQPHIAYICDQMSYELELVSATHAIALGYNTMKQFRREMDHIRAVPVDQDIDFEEKISICIRHDVINPLSRVFYNFASGFMDKNERQSYIH